jgi:hypothetical protein
MVKTYGLDHFHSKVMGMVKGLEKVMTLYKWEADQLVDQHHLCQQQGMVYLLPMGIQNDRGD